jgi:hypothetical protein
VESIPKAMVARKGKINGKESKGGDKTDRWNDLK